jgi:hypothetical protein
VRSSGLGKFRGVNELVENRVRINGRFGFSMEIIIVGVDIGMHGIVGQASWS